MMSHLKKSLGLVVLVLSNLLAVAPVARGAEAFYENPVIPGDHPDPSIIRDGKDFWASSTSSEWGPQFPLLHSTDLVNWEQVGSVFMHRPDWASANFWAPEISEHKGRYYVYYVGRQKSSGTLAVAVAVADKPTGPYKDYGPMVSQPAGSIDPAPCDDENGRRYLIWKDDNNSVHKQTTIWAQPMNEDFTKLVGAPTALIHNDADWEGPLVEGPYILRHGDYFYLFYSGNGCCGNDCHYGMGVARAKSLLGPWEKNPANPILAGNETWKCPGHGSIIQDKQGRYWLLYHAYSTRTSVYTGREAMLDEVKFGDDGWPTINGGRGPSVKSPSPFGVKQKRKDLAFYDDFSDAKLRPGWQWPQDNEPVYEVGHGKLVLSERAGHPADQLAVLARSTLTGDYTATTEVDLGSLKSDCAAGLSVFGDSHNAVGLSVGNGKLVLWRREHGKLWDISTNDAPKGRKLFLRLIARDGVDFHFAQSVDEKNWTPVGENLKGAGLPPWDRSIRLALTVNGPESASAEFDSFRIVPTNKTAKK